MISTNDLKNGMTLGVDNGLWSVVEFLHVKPGKGSAFVRTKLKNVVNGKVVEKTFRETGVISAMFLDDVFMGASRETPRDKTICEFGCGAGRMTEFLLRTWGNVYAYDVSETMIGLTIVAIGTSLPELATSAIAAFKKNADIAVGNVVGSNIFNVFWILGVSSIVKPIYTDESTIATDVAILITVSLLFFVILFVKKYSEISRWKGFLFVSCYVAYTLFLILRETGNL